jgi:hypothetical protein
MRYATMKDVEKAWKRLVIVLTIDIICLVFLILLVVFL